MGRVNWTKLFFSISFKSFIYGNLENLINRNIRIFEITLKKDVTNNLESFEFGKRTINCMLRIGNDIF